MKKLTKIVGVDPELTTRLKHLIVAVDGDQTKSVINKTVDTLGEDIDKIRMKNILRELYLEALNNDSI